MKEEMHASNLEASVDPEAAATLTVHSVAAERAREAAYERELDALRAGAAGAGAAGAEAEDEARERLERRLRRLRVAAAPRAALPDAAALLARLADALRARHDTSFLDDYLAALRAHAAVHARALTDQVMRSVESALSEAGGDVGVVVCAWLAGAAVWSAPRVVGAARALRCALDALAPAQVEEVARALSAALPAPHHLMALSDAARGGRGAGEAGAALLARLALGAALAAQLRAEGEAGEAREAREAAECSAGAPEAARAVRARWAALSAAGRLSTARLAGRVLCAAAARGEPAERAAPLLSAMSPPFPRGVPCDPDYIKVEVALERLQLLFAPAEPPPTPRPPPRAARP